MKAEKFISYDYLLKTNDVIELKDYLNKLIESKMNPDSVHANSNKLITLSVKDGMLFIKSEDIIRLQAQGSYTIFYLDNNVKHMVSKNLKECEKLLSETHFYRCHPSHVVNLQKVVRLVSSGGLFAQMCDGSMSDIVRKNKETFVQKLMNA
jgi:two-component system LytT family response regulator